MFHTKRLTAIAVLVGASGVAHAATCPADFDLGSTIGTDLNAILALTATPDTCGMVNDWSLNLGDAVSCAFQQESEDASFTWTAPATETYVMSLAGSSYDTALSVRSYTAGVDCGFTELACNDDFGGLQSQLSFAATAGETYLIIVDGYGSAGTNCGSWVLSINCNDADGDGVCDGVDVCDGDDAFGDTDGDGTCDDIDVCPTLPGGDADGDGICDAVDLCFGDDATGDSDGDGVCDDLDACIGDDASGDNDGDGLCNDTDTVCDNFFADLGSVTGTAVATGTTVGFGDTIYAYCALNGNSTAEDIQYLWTAPVAGDYTISTDSSSYDTVLTVGDPADCGSSASIACDDDAGAGLQSLVNVTLSAGQQIVINIDGYAANAGDYVLNIISNVCIDDDGDGVCNDVDICFGDDASGDGDSDGLCDDLDVVLDVSPISGGSPVDFVVVHPAWTGRVYVLGSFQGPGAGPCLPSAGVCAGLVNPFVVGGAPADPLGVTVITRTPPASLPAGRNVAFQAGVVDPPNSTGQMSNIVIRTTM